MSRLLLWGFVLADLVGVCWCVRVLLREARRLLALRRAREAEAQRPVLELPVGFVVVPARVLPRPRPVAPPLLRRVG